MGRKKSVLHDVMEESVETINGKIEFFQSGSTLLDLALGGGYAVGRIINIYGPEASGKSFMAVQAVVGFLKKYPDAFVFYVDSEHTLDERFASAVGLPPFNDRRVLVDDVVTMQDFYTRLQQFKKLLVDNPTSHGLFVLDSLDALQDEDEPDKISTGYMTEKAKIMSHHICPLLYGSSKEVGDRGTYYIVSQARDNLKSGFVQTETRSGGRALRFSVSQLIHLKLKEKLGRAYRGIRMVYGVMVQATVEKNKVGLPYRQASFPILFDHGIADEISCMMWLKSVKSEFDENRFATGDYESVRTDLVDQVRREWEDIEDHMKSFSSTGTSSETLN